MLPAGFVPAVSMRYTLAAMQTDELLTYEELGELLRLKKTAMAAAKRRGDLPPAIRIGRKNQHEQPTLNPVRKTGRRRGRPTKAEEVERRKVHGG